jgi:hypothetical protein
LLDGVFNLSNGGEYTPPQPPEGYFFVIDNADNYLIDNDGNYLIVNIVYYMIDNEFDQLIDNSGNFLITQ